MMTSDSHVPEDLVLQAVRGIIPWSDLEGIGIHFEESATGLVVRNPYKLMATAHPRDVAEGIIRLRQEPSQLEQWAKVLLAGSNVVHLNLDDRGYGEALLAGLWELASGEEMPVSATLAAEELYLDSGR